MSASRNRNSGLGSYSYRSAYNHEDDDEGIPVVNCTSRRVELLVYPVDGASASGCSFLSTITGKEIKHSTIVAFGVEYEFSREGVETKIRSRNRIPSPEEEIDLGCTKKDASELRAFVNELRRTEYKGCQYDVSLNNCHNFCNDLSLFLTGEPIPRRFLEMADEVTAQATKMALITGGAVLAGAAVYNLLPAREERPQAQGAREPQVQQNNNSLLMGLGAVAAGGLAYHMLSSSEEPQREPQRQAQRQSWQRATSQDESGFGDTGFLGALAAGAASLAQALDSNQQPQQRALGFGARNNNADENGPAEWLERMLNLR